MSDMRTRLITASIFIPLIILFISIRELTFVLVILASLVNHFEFRQISHNILMKIVKQEENKQFISLLTSSKWFYFIIILQHMIMFIGPYIQILVLLLYSTIMAFFILRLTKLLQYLKHHQLNNELTLICLLQIMIDSIEYTLYIYPTNFLGYFIHFNNHTRVFGFWFLMIYQSDNGALFFGKLFGKQKLCQIVSPSKTFQGLIGAIIFPILTAILLKFAQDYNYFIFFENVNTYSYILLSFIMGLGSVSGDFLESFIKRSGDVKDSGSIFPGHGGMLDRTDSLYMTAPIYFLYVKYYIGLDNLHTMFQS